MRALSLVLTCLVVSACAKKTRGPLHFNQTTKEELISIKGDPERVDEIPPKDQEVLVYADNEKFQIKDSKVLNRFRDPTEQEKQLNYWRNLYSRCDFKVVREKNAHAHDDVHYQCLEEGLSLIYNEGTGEVIRVVEYAKP